MSREFELDPLEHPRSVAAVEDNMPRGTMFHWRYRLPNQSKHYSVVNKEGLPDNAIDETYFEEGQNVTTIEMTGSEGTVYHTHDKEPTLKVEGLPVHWR